MIMINRDRNLRLPRPSTAAVHVYVHQVHAHVDRNVMINLLELSLHKSLIKVQAIDSIPMSVTVEITPFLFPHCKIYV